MIALVNGDFRLSEILPRLVQATRAFLPATGVGILSLDGDRDVVLQYGTPFGVHAHRVAVADLPPVLRPPWPAETVVSARELEANASNKVVARLLWAGMPDAHVQRSIEILIGKLATDADFRRAFQCNPRGTLHQASEWGLALTESEVRALWRPTRPSGTGSPTSSTADVATARSHRLPQFHVDAEVSQLLRPVDVWFNEGTFGTYPGVGPVPATDTRITTPQKPSFVLSATAAQPLTQLFRLNLNVQLTADSTHSILTNIHLSTYVD